MNTHEQKVICVQKKCIDDCIQAFGEAFTWSETIDGHKYWDDIHGKLISLRRNSTSDYNPKPDVVITDAWLIQFIKNHRRRPKVTVRDSDVACWLSDVRELCCINPRGGQFMVASATGISSWRYCKLAEGEPES